MTLLWISIAVMAVGMVLYIPQVSWRQFPKFWESLSYISPGIMILGLIGVLSFMLGLL